MLAFHATLDMICALGRIWWLGLRLVWAVLVDEFQISLLVTVGRKYTYARTHAKHYIFEDDVIPVVGAMVVVVILVLVVVGLPSPRFSVSRA